MTADRFGAIANGEYTALASMRDGRAHRLEQSAAEVDPGSTPAEPNPAVDAMPPTVGAAPSSGSASARPGWRPIPPPQHGAWAFLIVPVLCGFAVAGATLAGWVFLAAWVCAYPVGYYLGRGLTARVRRGSWTRLARREGSRAVPWAVITGALGIPLLLTRPWLIAAGFLLGVLWALGLWVAAHRGERSVANDLLLVAQATVALPLAVAVVAGPAAVRGDLAGPTLQATLIVAGYLTGSVLHVKSLLREAGRPAFRRVDVAWHAALATVAALLNPWWLVGFGPALARAVLMGPGLRAGAIGGVEAVVAVLVVVSAFLVF
ncbi:MAG: YwiC-like family protein [Actinomycetota bacterium]|nr:YwiC-like family protein [Actinomycetota bacterium]